MSDGSLSQDEIDALLQGGGGFDFGGEESAGQAPAGLSQEQQMAFASKLSGAVSSQASNLSGIIGKSVNIGKPEVEFMTRDGFVGTAPEQLVVTSIGFSEGIVGEHMYLMPVNLATAIAGLMMGQEQIDLDEAALSALSEAGNTLAGAIATTLGDAVRKTVMTSPGETEILSRDDISLPGDGFLRVSYPVTIEGEKPSQLMEVFSISAVSDVVKPQQASPSPGVQPSSQMGAMGQGMMGGGMQQQMPQGMSMSYQQPPNVQSVQFPNLYPQAAAGDQGNIGLLMDVYMEMTVELGRTKRLIREILGMGEGTIIELDKLAGEPVDILVNHKLIAKGEVVVIDENFGVRVTEIVSPMERMSDLT
ncbi:flagellar motor switch protein FliN [Marispirochaeta aestuarii]|uniref:Flagellar motor switch protein FliN n=1 Tax=Marispirochaeta aestuarii TaxID=1963862 RepID=A0A1Y1RW49_9SPIO|nr:flagellar motor switch phosphatase FliY [Marispirochaeta aestuarii]ORC34265.1 flagellar motor switch protein FliN [Marispirochaeta aestuarii]